MRCRALVTVVSVVRSAFAAAATSGSHDDASRGDSPGSGSTGLRRSRVPNKLQRDVGQGEDVDA